MEKTFIEIFDIKILEPSATVTDLAVSVVCFYAFVKLRQLKRKDKAFFFFNWFFLTMGIATFFGGVLGHAFLYAVDFAWKLPGWIMSMLSISLLERASIKHAKKYLPSKIAKFYEVANIIELIVVMGITFYSLDFFYVEIHSGFGMLAVILPVQAYTYYKNPNEGSKWFLAGVGVTLISAVIFMNKISIHAWFDHLAISHTIMIAGAYVFFITANKVKSEE